MVVDLACQRWDGEAGLLGRGGSKVGGVAGSWRVCRGGRSQADLSIRSLSGWVGEGQKSKRKGRVGAARQGAMQHG